MTLNAPGTFDISGDVTLSGDVTGISAGTLSKDGTSTLTLSGTNNYSGATNINIGTLKAGSTGALSGNSDFTVSVGATLDFDTFANTIGNLTNSGTVTSKAKINATTYTQNSDLSLDFPMASATPVGNIETTGKITLDGTLTVTNTGGFAPVAGTVVTLLKSTGSGKQLFGTFSSHTLPFGKLTYDHKDNEVSIRVSACDATWVSTSNGSWTTDANWDPGTCSPGIGGIIGTATFANVAASSITVDLAVTSTLSDLDFTATTTSFTINGAGKIDLDHSTVTPLISIVGGSHTIDVPITLIKNSRFSLGGGTLTLGLNTVTGAFDVNIIEGSGSGTLINNATFSNTNILIEGGTFENNGNVSPTGTMTIDGLSGIINPATVINHSIMTPGGAFTIGGAGPTVVTNKGTMSSGGGGAFTIAGPGSTVVTNETTMSSSAGFTISSGTVSNTLSGTMKASAGSTFSITGGSVSNGVSAVLGSTDANLSLSGGSLTTTGSVKALDYTQSGSSTLTIGVSNVSSFGDVAASGAATIGGSLVIEALSDFSMTSGQTVDLITTTNGRTDTFTSSFQNFPSSVIPTLVAKTNVLQLDITATIPMHLAAAVQVVFTSVSQHNNLITQKSIQLRNRFPKSSSAAPDFLLYSKANPKTDLQGSESSEEESCGMFLEGEQYAENDPEIVQKMNPEDTSMIAQRFNPQISEKQRQLADRISDLDRKSTSIYLGPIASFGDIKTKGDQVGMGYSSLGGLLGFDHVREDLESRPYYQGWGAIVEYRRNSATAKDHWGTMTIHKVHGSCYFTTVPKSIPQIAIDGILGFAYTWDHLHRRTGINKQQTAIGNPKEKIVDMLFGVEYTLSNRFYAFMPKNLSFVPLINIQYVYDRIGGYTEKNAGRFNLRVKPLTIDSFTTFLGTRLRQLFTGANGTCHLEFDAGWQREFLDHNRPITFNAFNVTSNTTTANTVGAGRNSLLLGLDLFTTFRSGFTIEASSYFQYNSLFYDMFFYAGIGGEF